MPVSRADADPTIAPNVDATKEASVRLAKLASELGIEAVLGAAKTLPDFLDLTVGERILKAQEVARTRFLDVIARQGVINSAVQNQITEDLQLRADEVRAVLYVLEEQGVIEEGRLGYVKALTPKQVEADETLSPEARAKKKHAAEMKWYELAKTRIIEVFDDRYGISVTDLMQDMKRKYPEFGDAVVISVIEESLRRRYFGIGEHDEIFELKREKTDV